MEAEEGAPSPVAAETERRTEPRLPVEEEASITVVSRGVHLMGSIVEVSLSGCRLTVRDRFAFANGTRVEVGFKMRGIGFRFTGQVEWCDAGGLIGVRFVNVIARRMDELVEVLAELAAEQAAKAVRQAAQRMAAEEKARGGGANSAGNPEPPKAAADPGTAPEPVKIAPRPLELASTSKPAGGPAKSGNQAQAAQPNTETQPANPAGKERRGQSRHEVDTSATILLVNIASRLSGRILNLSLGGCRVRTEERFPVGIYTRVETEFYLEGLPFRLGGVVQAIQDRHHVGIRFLDMSTRKREQLAQLIAEIEALEGPRKSAGS